MRHVPACSNQGSSLNTHTHISILEDVPVAELVYGVF